MDFNDFAVSEEMIWACAAAFAFMILDIVSGVFKAAKKGDLSSSKMREGLYHKGGYIIALVAAWLVEVFVLHIPDIGFTVPLLIPACVYIVSTEIVSVLENVSAVNPYISDKLTNLFGRRDG